MLMKGKGPDSTDKTNKRPDDMQAPTAPQLPKIPTSYRIRADVDLTIKALYEMPKSAMWEALYDWVDSPPGSISAKPVLTMLLMWAAHEAEPVGPSAWRSSVSFVLGFNDSVNPLSQPLQLTWNPVVGTGRSRVSVVVKFLIKPSQRPGISAKSIWDKMMENSDAKKFAEEAGFSVSPYSEALYGESL